MSLDRLREIDGLRDADFGGRNVLVHDDHRWVLPIIHDAQMKGDLEQPSTLLLFDAHHDAKAIDCKDALATARKSGLTDESLMEICRDQLSHQDDDWVRAGMELGLIGDAVVFGVSCRDLSPELLTFHDNVGNPHVIKMIGLPGGELKGNGDLGDVVRRGELAELWGILGWDVDLDDGAFGFADDTKRFHLDIDLDCFVVDWPRHSGYLFPWPEEVFRREFMQNVPNGAVGWSGKRFFDALVARSGLTTIAREPTFCGGQEKTDETLRRVNTHLFDGGLSL